MNFMYEIKLGKTVKQQLRYANSNGMKIIQINKNVIPNKGGSFFVWVIDSLWHCFLSQNKGPCLILFEEKPCVAPFLISLTQPSTDIRLGKRKFWALSFSSDIFIVNCLVQAGSKKRSMQACNYLITFQSLMHVQVRW